MPITYGYLDGAVETASPSNQNYRLGLAELDKNGSDTTLDDIVAIHAAIQLDSGSLTHSAPYHEAGASKKDLSWTATVENTSYEDEITINAIIMYVTGTFGIVALVGWADIDTITVPVREEIADNDDPGDPGYGDPDIRTHKVDVDVVFTVAAEEG